MTQLINLTIAIALTITAIGLLVQLDKVWSEEE